MFITISGVSNVPLTHSSTLELLHTRKFISPPCLRTLQTVSASDWLCVYVLGLRNQDGGGAVSGAALETEKRSGIRAKII